MSQRGYSMLVDSVENRITRGFGQSLFLPHSLFVYFIVHYDHDHPRDPERHRGTYNGVCPIHYEDAHLTRMRKSAQFEDAKTWGTMLLIYLLCKFKTSFEEIRSRIILI